MDVKLADMVAEAGFAPLKIREDGYGLTVEEYAQHLHCSIPAARDALNQAAEAGLLVKEMMMVKGRKSIVYVRNK